MIGKANHQDAEKEGFIYQRGEFSTTYEEIREALRTYQHHRKTLPTLKQVRIMLDWFGEKGMIEKTPLRKKQRPPISHPFPTQTHGVAADLGAYTGLKIKIVNYDLYQTLDNYKGRPKGRDKGRERADQGHNNKNEKNENNEREDNISCRSSKRKTDADIEDFFDFYQWKFNDYFRKPPFIDDEKDRGRVERLFQVLPSDELKPLLTCFFTFTSPLIQQLGYTIEAFESQINKLRIKEDGKPLSYRRLYEKFAALQEPTTFEISYGQQ